MSIFVNLLYHKVFFETNINGKKIQKSTNLCNGKKVLLVHVQIKEVKSNLIFSNNSILMKKTKIFIFNLVKMNLNSKQLMIISIKEKFQIIFHLKLNKKSQILKRKQKFNHYQILEKKHHKKASRKLIQNIPIKKYKKILMKSKRKLANLTL